MISYPAVAEPSSRTAPAAVLVVDDEAVAREVFGIWLEDAGYVVTGTGSESAVRAVLAEAEFDVLLSDARLMRGVGLDLLTWAREHAPDMPIVLVTGRPDVDSAVDALRRGAYDYLVKPVDAHDLLRVVAKAVSHARLVRERRRLTEENNRYRRHLETQVAERTEALKRRNQQLLVLNEVVTRIGSLQALATFFARVAEAVHEAFGYAEVALYSAQEAHAFRLEALASRMRAVEPAADGDEPDAVSPRLLRAVQSGQIQIANHPLALEAEALASARPWLKSEAIFPIRVDDRCGAVLAVAQDRAQAFDEVDVMVLRTLVEHLSVAIENAQLLSRLQDALAARDQMLATVSHELRSPLAVISIWSEMLAEGTVGPGDTDTRQAAHNILTSATHLTHLVNRLLTFHGLAADEMPLEPIFISGLVRDAVAAWQPVMERHGVALTFEPPDQEVWAEGNEEYLRQVLNNLLDNARKFCPNGGKTRVRAWRQGDEVRIAVADNGIGVDAEQLDRLFERFYQIDGGTARQFEGMGLGLSLSREIMRRHGGRIWAESAGKGMGTTLSIALPAVTPDLADM